ncbi:hypothetical protein GQ457_14G025240 [Hibiscus cannabinus]
MPPLLSSCYSSEEMTQKPRKSPEPFVFAAVDRHSGEVSDDLRPSTEGPQAPLHLCRTGIPKRRLNLRENGSKASTSPPPIHVFRRRIVLVSRYVTPCRSSFLLTVGIHCRSLLSPATNVVKNGWPKGTAGSVDKDTHGAASNVHKRGAAIGFLMVFWIGLGKWYWARYRVGLY